MTDRELMQQALDTLELVTHLTSYDDEVYEAIFALRARLAQPEPEPVATLFGSLPVYDVPSKQEPVAWMYDWYDETEDIDGVPIGGIVHDWISKDYDEAHSPTMGCHNIRPLYTAPPQREWQGLTDEEIEKIEMSAFSILSAIYLAEAQLKGENNG